MHFRLHNRNVWIGIFILVLAGALLLGNLGWDCRHAKAGLGGDNNIGKRSSQYTSQTAENTQDIPRNAVEKNMTTALAHESESQFIKRAKAMPVPELEANLERLANNPDNHKLILKILDDACLERGPRLKNSKPPADQIISYQEQIRLCERFAPECMDNVHWQVWLDYMHDRDFEAYRREILDVMKPSQIRSRSYRDYYLATCDDTSALKSILETTQLDDLNNDAGNNGGRAKSNYDSALSGLSTACGMMIHAHLVTKQEIIQIIESSGAGQEHKNNLIQRVRQRTFDVPDE